jgi:hypothetical protein
MVQNVVVIKRDNGNVIAIIENPQNCMSAGAVALAWAKSQGMKKLPFYCEYEECPYTCYDVVQLALTPCHELEELEEAGKDN